MSIQDVINLLPSTAKEVFFLTIILSLVEISPLKLNPWQWLKSFADIPQKVNKLSEDLDKLDREFKDDRAFRWRNMIINRGDRIQDGHKFRREVWEDTMETITNYKKYCDKNPDFKNELATMTIQYLENEFLKAKQSDNFIKEVGNEHY